MVSGLRWLGVGNIMRVSALGPMVSRRLDYKVVPDKFLNSCRFILGAGLGHGGRDARGSYVTDIGVNKVYIDSAVWGYTAGRTREITGRDLALHSICARLSSEINSPSLF